MDALLHQRDPGGVDRPHAGSIAAISERRVAGERNLVRDDLAAATTAAGRVVALELDFLLGEIDRPGDVDVRSAVYPVHIARIGGRSGASTLIEGDSLVAAGRRRGEVDG